MPGGEVQAVKKKLISSGYFQKFSNRPRRKI
jgi:hypothetical protein